ncbi:transmembrane emp24 domain-containing protein p24delta9-like [Cucurbita pepo subsp. pepo]|uniref:transmembrane emp24 domain-containing protein p24delta9-like n=1 Tax=Cucurbita pepo subsp. pepo TaxID=3664 RepID=UPI000C9D4A07|nr:transmembrane emp24 domain-containing protein p24delta9-like [Cucurbita pepo subsp. pepo]
MVPSFAAFQLLLLIGFLSSGSESLRFDLQSGHTKCISEDIKQNAMTVGKYHVVNPNEAQPLTDDRKLVVRVTSTTGNTFHYSDKVESGQFAFVAGEGGDFMTCFWVPDHKPQVTLTVDFDWRTGVAAKQWSSVAKKGDVEAMEFEMQKLFETANSIQEEMYYLREREEEMQDLNASTNTKMARLSFLSLFVCLSVAGLQIWHLKTFFHKKKLI